MAAGRKGKYLDWITPEGLLKLEAWARNGLTGEQIAKNIGIRRETLIQWSNQFSNISNALKRGKEIVDFEVENALLKRALGYEYEEVKTVLEKDATGATKSKIEKTKKQIQPDVTAQIFWLKNRMSKQWRDVHKFEHTGEDGGPIQNAGLDITNMSLEDIERELNKLEHLNKRIKKHSVEVGETEENITE
jgi:transcriptional regulator with XRE-family HTH domain